MKKHEFLSENFQFLLVKFSIYLNRLVFVMSKCRLYFISFRIIETILVILKTEYRLSRRRCGMRVRIQPQKLHVAYEETQSNRVSDFRVCFLVLCFQRQSFFTLLCALSHDIDKS